MLKFETTKEEKERLNRLAALILQRLEQAKEEIKEQEIFGSDIDVARASGRVDAYETLLKELNVILERI